MKNASLNHTYRLVWSDVAGNYVAVPEFTAGRGKRTRAGRAAASVLALAAAMASPFATAGPPAVDALPTGGTIVHGSGSIGSAGATLTVQQSSQRLVTNWSGFNIGSGATVNFVQPSASSQALNRITGQDPSQILGRLNANGQVFLVNPNGIVFGPNSQVNVGGLVASTLQMSDADFLGGQLRFTGGNGAGGIVNQGSLSGKVVALVAPQVRNEGRISATGGNAVLASGDQVTLDFGGDGLIKVAVDKGAYQALVENKGLVEADGGQIVMTARTADALLSTVVNNEGTLQARTLENRSGRILLLGDMDNGRTVVAGTLDASAPNGGDGGFIETSAHKVSFADGVKISTDAPYGKTGEWLIDPVDFTIAASGGNITGAALVDLLQVNNVRIQTQAGTNSATDLFGSGGTAGDIFVNDKIRTDASLGADRTLTLQADRRIVFRNGSEIDATLGGNTHKLNLVLWANKSGTGGNIKLGEISGNGTSGANAANTVVIKTNGGHVWLGGGAGAATWNGLDVGDGFATGLVASGDLAGIYTGRVNLLTAGGDIAMFGRGAAATNDWNAAGDSQVNMSGFVSDFKAPFTIDSGVGSITIEARAPTTTNPRGYGKTFFMNGGTITSAKATGDAITITSDATGVASLDDVAVLIVGRASLNRTGENFPSVDNLISATGGGNIVITGIQGRNDWSAVTINASRITTALGGNITINGTASVTSPANVAIFTGRTGDIEASGQLFINSNRGVVGLTGKTASGGDASFTFNGANPGFLYVWNEDYFSNTNNFSFTSATANAIAGEISVSNATNVDIRNGVSTILGDITASGPVRVAVTGATSDLTIAAGKQVASSSAGRDAVILSTAGKFINEAGASAISLTGSGTDKRWVVYSKTPADNTFGDLVSGNQALWGRAQTILNNGAALLTPAGNRYVFTVPGELAVVLIGAPITKVYGETISLSHKVGGLSEHTQYGSVFNVAYSGGEPSASYAGTGPTADVGQYDVTANWAGITIQSDVTALAKSPDQVTVLQRPVQLAGLSAADKMYDGTVAAAVSGTPTFGAVAANALSGVVNGDVLSLSGTVTGEFASKNVGSGIDVIQSGVSLAGGKAGNYILLGQDLKASITPKPLTVSGITASDKVYDGNTSAVVSVTGARYEGLIEGDSFSVAATGVFSSKNVGAVKTVSLTSNYSGDDAGNYVITDQATTTAAITARPLSVSGLTANDKVYDGNTAATIHVSAATLDGLVEGDRVTVSAAGIFSDKNVGNSKTVTLSAAYSGADAGNYAITTDASTTASITPRPLVVSGIIANDKTYDGNTSATINLASAQYAGLVAGDSFSVAVGGTFSDPNSGIAKTVRLDNSYSGADVGNYTITGQETTTASIRPLPQAVVTALIARQEGITGTQVSSPLSTNPILPGVGAVGLAAASANPVIADNASPQAVWTLASNAGRSTLRTEGTVERRPVSSPAMPIFNATRPATDPTESATRVTDQGSSLSADEATGNGTSLTVGAAIDSAARGAQRVRAVDAEARLPDGRTPKMSVSFTAERVLVVRMKDGATVETGTEQAITLYALAAATQRLGVSVADLRGVLITGAR